MEVIAQVRALPPLLDHLSIFLPSFFLAGAISEGEVIGQVWALLLGGIGVAAVLDTWAGHDFPIMTVLAIFGSFISYVSHA